MQEVGEHRYRLWYMKDELLRFVGHLDTVNLVVRAMRRAGLPLVYTEGFSQKPRLITSPPLPLGFTSRMELMDFALTERVDPDEIAQSLKREEEPRKLIHRVRALSDADPKLSRVLYSSLVELMFKYDEREMTDKDVEECLRELGVNATCGLLGWGANDDRLRINCRVHTGALPLGKFAKDVANKLGTRLVVGERIMLLTKDGGLAF
jgi:hypothetical protein